MEEHLSEESLEKMESKEEKVAVKFVLKYSKDLRFLQEILFYRRPYHLVFLIVFVYIFFNLYQLLNLPFLNWCMIFYFCYKFFSSKNIKTIFLKTLFQPLPPEPKLNPPQPNRIRNESELVSIIAQIYEFMEIFINLFQSKDLICQITSLSLLFSAFLFVTIVHPFYSLIYLIELLLILPGFLLSPRIYPGLCKLFKPRSKVTME